MVSELRAALAQHSTKSASDAQILFRSAEVGPLVRDVIQHADLEKDALGFFPEDVYHSAAAAGHLLIACRTDGKEHRFLGHLLFGGAFPHARIYQLYVVPDRRGRGIAKSLVSKLIQIVEQTGFMDITARAAADLAANAVWEKLGFPIARIQAGGSSRKRIINVRVKYLNTPTLFGYPEGEPVSSLPIAGRAATFYTPVYAADLNVFFDVVKRRPRADLASKLISAALDSVIRLVVAEEFIAELKRCATSQNPDPVYEFSLQLPTISRPQEPRLQQIETELANLVFPERARNNRLTTQDRSDLVHLATAISHSVNGFVTAEKALIEAGDQIQAAYGLTIVDVAEIAHVLQARKRRVTTIETRFAGHDLHLSELTDVLRAELNSLIDKLPAFKDGLRGLGPNVVPSSNDRSLAVSLDGSLVCAAIWRCSGTLQGKLSALLISDEDHPAIESAIDAVLLALSEEAVVEGPSLIEVVVPDALTLTRDLTLSLGFVAREGTISGATAYHRMAIGRAVVADNWTALKTTIAIETGNQFPEQLPAYEPANPRVAFHASTGVPHQIAFDDLELALAPVVFCSPGRAYFLVPIRRTFADYLLNTAPQSSLLPPKEAALFHERVYYSSARNRNLFTAGCAMIFYESGARHGRSSAIAMARVRETATVSKTELASTLIRHGVLDRNEIESLTNRAHVAATIFDNLVRFRKSVPLQILRELRCVDGANLVRARRLDLDQAVAIVQRGYSLES